MVLLPSFTVKFILTKQTDVYNIFRNVFIHSLGYMVLHMSRIVDTTNQVKTCDYLCLNKENVLARYRMKSQEENHVIQS